MSLSETAVTSTETSSGLLAEAIGGVATIVLAILALSNVSPNFLLAIATIVFGAALLIEATSIAAQLAHMVTSPAGPAAVEVQGGGLAAVFAAGLTGIILGVLALLGIHPLVLTSISTIVFGSALVLNSTSGARFPQSAVARGFGTVGAQVMAGVAAIVLGILSVAGEQQLTLALVALLVLGAAILMTGNGMNNAVFALLRGNGAMGAAAGRGAIRP